MRKHPKVFDSLYSNMIEAGETGGILDTIMNRLGAYIEKDKELLDYLDLRKIRFDKEKQEEILVISSFYKPD